MELRHLRYFIALAERLSFTRAAAQVHVTQSTLSHQIRKLENEIGQSLFERAGKRVIRLRAGELLLPSVTRALNEIDSGIRSIQGAGPQLAGHLRIGATHTFSINLVPTALQRSLRATPLSWSHIAALESCSNAPVTPPTAGEFGLLSPPPGNPFPFFAAQLTGPVELQPSTRAKLSPLAL
jgi:DNA-binding transcriptional LysR family regulator